MPRHCRRSAALALALALAAAGGCGAGDSQPPPAFRVALLTPGSIADGGWNAGAHEGLKRIASELGAEVSHVETRTPAEFEEGFRDYAARGYSLVFGHGFEYQEAAAKVAAEYPETIFVTTSGSTVRPNVAPMVFELEQATYLCGVLAARMTKTRKVGLIGGIDLPSIRSTFVALGGGVADTRPTVNVREVFIGNFDDTAAAREAALALLESGADFLMHQANDAGRGVFQAVQEWVAQGHVAYAFGTNRDQNAMAPDVVLASAVLDLPGAFVEVARRVKAGRFEAAPMRLGMAQGIVSLVVNPALRERIPPDVQEELARIEQEIRSGERTVPRGTF
jgi:basic membrane lipoprotein Med (substrate-binding protein (PBP1-ABC) superfamily)